MNFSSKNILAAAFVIYFISATLLSTDKHVSQIGSSFYGFLIAGSLLVCFAGVLLLFVKKKLTVTIKSAQVFFALYLLYFLVLDVGILREGVNMYHLYYGVGFLLLTTLPLVEKIGDLSFKQLAKIVSVIAGLQVAICFMQFFGSPASGSFFEVHGTLPNPNLTGVFLAMATPFVGYWVFQDRNKGLKFRLILPFAILTALVLLNCRTAIIGFFMSLGYLLLSLPEIKVWIKRLGKTQRRLGLLSATVLMAVAITVLFNVEKGSSDGRLFVWKISFAAIAENPIVGHGLNSFNRVYNLEQARYFATGAGSEQEKFGAGYINIAYNDFIQNLVEGGMIGTILFIAFLISLLQTGFPFREADLELTTAHAAVVIFMVMALFNSIELAGCAVAMLMLYTPRLLNKSAVPKKRSLAVARPKLLAALFILLGTGTLWYSAQLRAASMKIKEASELIKTGHATEALTMLQPHQQLHNRNPDYWNTVGQAFEKEKQYNSALRAYHHSTSIASDPEIFSKIGQLAHNMGISDYAVESCRISTNIIPNKLRYKLYLMNIYHSMGDSENAITIAHQMINQKRKGAADPTPYKHAAQHIIDQRIQNHN